MICPDCGARNTADAPWCTQCLRRLGPAAEDTPAEVPDDGATLFGGGGTATGTDTPSGPGAPHVPDTGTPAPPASGPRDRGPSADRDRSIRSVDGRVEWRCPACETWNDLEVPVCTVCGQRLGATVTGEGPGALTARVGRARRMLWIAAGVGAVLMVVAVVLLVAVLRTGS